ncbi:MAG TPA: hypothetical protein VFI52_00385, partial [Gemmatimonadaceae bacterium]|nr:hypothetical protein [Gemmatimonadaceae bacterium]
MRSLRGASAVALCGVLLACGGDKGANTQRSAATPTKDTSSAEGSATTSATVASGRKTVLFLGTSLTAGLGLEPDSAFP